MTAQEMYECFFLFLFGMATGLAIACSIVAHQRKHPK